MASIIQTNSMNKINNTGFGSPGIPTIGNKPNLGNIILKKYKGLLHAGFKDLENFELIDRLEKPVLDFIFTGTKRQILEIYELLLQYPYAFAIRTKKGYDLLSLPEKGVRNAYVHISRFPKLIKFIVDYEEKIPSDLWGILYGYKLNEIHQFTYDWEEWSKNKR